MGRSQKAERKRGRRLFYSIPVIALIIALVAYFPALAPPPVAALNFTVKISIQYSTQTFSNGTNALQFIGLSGIGLPGYTWKNHTYDGDGLDGRYPLYVDPPSSASSGQYPGFSVIHVRSRAVRNYTLGDFFAVWGYPIGPSRTFLFDSKPGGPSWSMCVGPSATSLRPGHWGAEVLNQNVPIILRYSSNPCL